MKVRQNYIALLRPEFALLPSDLSLQTVARVDDVDQSNQSDALIDGTQSRHVDTKAVETANDVETLRCLVSSQFRAFMAKSM